MLEYAVAGAIGFGSSLAASMLNDFLKKPIFWLIYYYSSPFLELRKLLT